MSINQLLKNHPCWCASGKPFRKCHGKLSNLKPLPFQQINATKGGVRKEKCHHPRAPHDCEGKPISSHTLQRSGSLRHISEQGHVLTFYSPGHVGSDFSCPVSPVERGVRNASTFPGFCRNHDGEMFSAIENQKIIPSQQQCFLFNYRNLAFELWCKTHGTVEGNTIDQIARGKNYREQQDACHMIESFNKSIRLAVDDLTHEIDNAQALWLDSNFSTTNALAVEFDGLATVAASACFSPTPSWSGDQIIDLTDPNSHADRATINLLVLSQMKSLFLLTWDGNTSPRCSKYAEEIINSDTSFIPQGIFQSILDHVENVHFRPSWWDNLENNERDYVSRRFASEQSLAIGNRVKKDGYAVVDWKVSQIKCIGGWNG